MSEKKAFESAKDELEAFLVRVEIILDTVSKRLEEFVELKKTKRREAVEESLRLLKNSQESLGVVASDFTSFCMSNRNKSDYFSLDRSVFWAIISSSIVLNGGIEDMEEYLANNSQNASTEDEQKET